MVKLRTFPPRAACEHLRRWICMLLTVIFTAQSLIAVGYASPYHSDDDEVIQEFADKYGWNREAMQSETWTGIDGKEHRRDTGYEKENFNDLASTSITYARDDLLAIRDADDPMYNAAWNDFLSELFQRYGIAADDLTFSSATSGMANGLGMVAVALAEIGAEGSYEIPKGAHANNVKYNEWFYGRPIHDHLDAQGRETYPWCCAFVAWCADQCGLLDSGTFTKTAGCGEMYAYLTQTNGFASYGTFDLTPFGGSYDPVPGDILLWREDGVFSHIGIISGVYDDHIDVVEGNADDRVLQESLSRRSIASDPKLTAGRVVHVEYPDGAGSVYYFLTRVMGMSSAGACGVMANIEAESNFNPLAVGDNGTSHGICQWHNERWANLTAYCGGLGYAPESMDGQLMFLQYELSAGYSDLLDFLINTPDAASGAYEAGYQWCVRFERPSNANSKGMGRGNVAKNKYWPEWGGK